MKLFLLYLIIEKMQYNTLGKYIKIKRKTAGITLNKFAIDNDIEPAILSRIENSKQDIKMGVLVKIAKGFNTTPAKFLSKFEHECSSNNKII